MPTPDTPSPAGFPLVAILPDLWTVYRAEVPVSQHATLSLALRACQDLDKACGQRGAHGFMPPEHSPVVIAKAREAIKAAQRKAAQHDPRAHWIVCGCCSLWHDPDEDCPPPPRRVAGFDGSQEP